MTLIEQIKTDFSVPQIPVNLILFEKSIKSKIPNHFHD